MMSTIMASAILLLLPALLVLYYLSRDRRKAELKELNNLLDERKRLLKSLHERLDESDCQHAAPWHEICAKFASPKHVDIYLFQVPDSGNTKLQQVLASRFRVDDWFKGTSESWRAEPSKKEEFTCSTWEEKWRRPESERSATRATFRSTELVN